MADPAAKTTETSFYEQLGVPSTIPYTDLKKTYRQLALAYHPDRHAGDSSKMQRLNRAWFVLSDPIRRIEYDQSLDRTHHPDRTQQPVAKDSSLDPKASWLDGLRRQSMHLGREAARSATQALAIRHKCSRATYEGLAESVTDTFGDDIEEKVRLARQAGAAHLDLALVSAMIGTTNYCSKFLKRATQDGLTQRTIHKAQLVDRMWDNLAHGISRDIEMRLGGNPRTLKSLTGKRV
ncbi:MAG: J domain-containing protein [Acidimicrobiales bacterium]|jgi:hypothetical protein|nr:J domain-containing protein [Acidimicrobiales bacterium]